MSMDFVTLGGNLLGTIPLGDIVLYITPFNLFLFAVLLGFTVLIAFSKPETQIEATLQAKKISVSGLRHCICRRNDNWRFI